MKINTKKMTITVYILVLGGINSYRSDKFCGVVPVEDREKKTPRVEVKAIVITPHVIEAVYYICNTREGEREREGERS